MLSDPRWRFVGRLCLDFAMTGGRGEWAHFERLHTPSDLGDWFREGPLRVPGVSLNEDDLRAAVDLREAIQRVAFALLAQETPARDEVAAVNSFASAPPLVRALDPTSLTVSVIAPKSVRPLLAEIARDALDLASDPQARSRVRQCESPDCALVFFDDSRPGNRRWCSARRCGDRSRARAYRARKAAERAEGPANEEERR
jgi:predicted RNA-binding Zn ribbon-like protein